FTNRALAVELLRSPQLLEQFRLAVNRRQLSCSYVPRRQRQKTCGIDISCIGDKDNSVPIANSEPSLHTWRETRPLLPQLVHPNPPVRWRFSCLDRKRRGLRAIIDPLHQPLPMLWSNLVQRLSASHGNQEEQTPPHDVEVLQNFINL